MDAFQTFLVNLGATVPAGDGGAPMEGFDRARLADAADGDLQYRFGRTVRTVPLDQVHTLGEAERLLACLRPALARAGLPIRRIEGDRILIEVRGELVWVDVMRGIGGKVPAWQWAVRELRRAA